MSNSKSKKDDGSKSVVESVSGRDSMDVERIGDIIKNARATWFVLLGSLVFASVTLASVKDASFFLSTEQTKLPLLGISVPITSFFWAGALLIAALYTYLHLYLEQLWDALGDAEARVNGKPLADVIHPWLVSDSALRMRDRALHAGQHAPRKKKRKFGWKNRFRRLKRRLVKRRLDLLFCRWRSGQDLRLPNPATVEEGQRSSRRRGMSFISDIVSVLLVWGFGLVVIGWFWWRSMPAHDIRLTGWLALLVLWCVYIFWRSRSYAQARLGGRKTNVKAPVWLWPIMALVIGLTVVRTDVDLWKGYPRIDDSYLADDCTENQIEIQKRKHCGYILNLTQELVRPARAKLAETVFTQKPDDWLGFDISKQEFRVRWCQNMGGESCKINALDNSSRFADDQEKKFEAAWKQRWTAMFAAFSKPDLRGRRFEGADLRFAEMQGADLRFAEMQGADLRRAEMQGADLRFAEMQGADLSFAEMQGAYLSGAEMQGAYLSGAKMQGADLGGAEMQGVDLSLAKMQGVDLSLAKMQGADLRFAEMQGAYLSGAEMQGTNENIMVLQSTNLSESDFLAISLRFVDFTDAVVTKIRNFDKSFGDGSVVLPKHLARPAHWCERGLTDRVYWGRYRGWLESQEMFVFYDPELDQYPAIDPSVPCPE